MLKRLLGLFRFGDVCVPPKKDRDTKRARRRRQYLPDSSDWVDDGVNGASPFGGMTGWS